MNKVITSLCTGNPCRTLLWIGTRSSSEFSEIYDYCESHSLQIAYRKTLEQAITRRGSEVNRVVIARSDQALFDWQGAAELARSYSGSTAICVMGVLCEGVRHTERFVIAAAPNIKPIYARQWKETLPDWFGVWPIQVEVSTDSIERASKLTVAIVASHLAIAEPLLEIAASEGASAIWIRNADAIRIKNVDRVIWDDSVAPATTTMAWQSRLSAMNLAKNARHAWIAHCPRAHQVASAKAAGVDLVLSKPHSSASIKQWLGACESKSHLNVAVASKVA